jgi:cobalamin synthase
MPAPRTAPRRRRGRGEPPPAPWGSFPLVELSVLLALVLGVIGFLNWGPRGRVMVACAAALGSLAGLELSIREHFAGYRSHTTVLAATVAVAAIAVMFFARLPQIALMVVGAAIFATAFFVLRELFKRRSGGFGFR